MANSIFISLWGNPMKWEYTKYNFNDITECAVTSSRVIHDYVCPDAEAFIFLPDSIFPEFYKDNDSIGANIDKVTYIIKQDIMGKNDAKSVEFIGKSYLSLFPSIGPFTANGASFTLKTDINYLYTYFYNKSLNYMETQKELKKVIIDMTHGINFLQFIFLESIKYSCMVYSIRHRKNIEIEYYNSSPYSKGLPISIMLVRSLNISFKNVLSYLSRDFLNIYKNKKNSIIKYYNTSGLNVSPLYIKGCAIMALSVTLPYIAYALSQIKDLKVSRDDEVTLKLTKNNDINEITHEFTDYCKTYVENLAFFDVLMAMKDFMIYDDGIPIAKLYNALEIYFGGESDRIFVKSELARIKTGHNTDQEFSEINFSRNFKAHAGLLNTMYEIKDKQIRFKTVNHNNIKINTDWVIKRLINE